MRPGQGMVIQRPRSSSELGGIERPGSGLSIDTGFNGVADCVKPRLGYQLESFQ
jgi:hypothetical protein